jgi:hypothetical protein
MGRSGTLAAPASFFVLWTTICAASTANADLLSFETTPAGATPVDDQLLTMPYAINGGTARMFFDLNGNNAYDPSIDLHPAFEQIGSDNIDGFRSTFNNSFDLARPGYQAQLGNYFLRHPDDYSTVDVGAQSFIVDYDTLSTISALSGEIWDIDRLNSGERWRLEVLNTSGTILDSLLSPAGINQNSPSSLDSLPWTFRFTDLPSGVDKLRITFIGTKTTGIGFAFNNFSPDVAVPEPSSGLLAWCGLLTGGRYLLRRPFLRLKPSSALESAASSSCAPETLRVS